MNVIEQWRQSQVRRVPDGTLGTATGANTNSDNDSIYSSYLINLQLQIHTLLLTQSSTICPILIAHIVLLFENV